MIDLPKAKAIALDLVLSKAKHRDYDRTVTLTREYYRPIATGEGIESLMRRFDLRESEAAFDQRKRITQHTTEATWEALMNPIRKLESVNPTTDRIEYEPRNDVYKERLMSVLDKYQGGKPVDFYIGSLTDIAEIDPNSFELVVFDPFDPLKEFPRPYSVHVPAEDAWNYHYFNGDLEWFMLHRDIKYIYRDANPMNPGDKPVVKDGHRFVFYGSDHHILFEQVRPDLVGVPANKLIVDAIGVEVETPAFGVEYYLKVSGTELYKVVFYEQKSGVVPLFRLGSKKDMQTDGRTCVSTLHPALRYLLKSIKQVSELDLTTALHVFPKEYSYVPPCAAEGCRDGNTIGGGKCEVCKGTGKMTIGTAQEMVTMALPDNPTEMIDLAKMSYYVPMPVELVQQMREIVEETRVNSFRAVWASDIYTKDQTNVTATAKMHELNNVYSALSTRVAWREFVKPYAVTVIANYLDVSANLEVATVMPQNLQYETAGDMIALVKEAQGAGVGSAVIQTLTINLIPRLTVDDPMAAKRAVTRERFNPFSGKQEATILALIAGGKVSEASEVMWTEMSSIFDEAEQQYEGKEVGFYDLAPAKQRDIIYAIRDRIIEERAAKKEENMQRFDLGTNDQNLVTEPDPVDDPEQEQVANDAP